MMTTKTETPTQARTSQEFMTLLRTYRISSGLEQDDIARRMKVSKSAVSLWETGRSNPKSRHIPKLAKMLGITPIALTKMLYPEAREHASAK